MMAQSLSAQVQEMVLVLLLSMALTKYLLLLTKEWKQKYIYSLTLHLTEFLNLKVSTNLDGIYLNKMIWSVSLKVVRGVDLKIIKV